MKPVTPERLSAVVTGATGDIGRAICLGLAGEGMRLCLVARNAARLQQLAASAPLAAGASVACATDLVDEASIAKLASALSHDPGRVDVLVHSAGAFAMAPHESASAADLDLLYRTNVRGPYVLTQALLPMLRASRGQIVFVNSSAGLGARAGIGQYACTQHGLRAVADALRAEVNRHGVRVLNLHLGRTATARQERIFALEGRPYAPALLLQPADVAEMVVAALRLPRTAEVTEIRMRPMIKSY